jgi:hypothetical protein
MKKFLLKMLLPYIKKQLKKNKSKIIKLVNKKVNIPRMTEKEEADLYSAIFDAIIEVI